MVELRCLIVVLGDQLDLDAAALDGAFIGVSLHIAHRILTGATSS